MPLLAHPEILRIHQAAIDAGLARSRDVLLAGIDEGFRTSLPSVSDPQGQILSDLDAMNVTGALADGKVPLWIWLDNAVLLAGLRKEAALFRRARAGGAAAARRWLALGLVIAAALAGLGVWRGVYFREKDPVGAGASASTGGLSSGSANPAVATTTAPEPASSARPLPALTGSADTAGRKPAPDPSAPAAPASSRALSGTARCEGTTCTLSLAGGTFEKAIRVCVDTEVEGVPVKCMIDGDPAGARSARCPRSDPEPDRRPLRGTFAWHSCPR